MAPSISTIHRQRRQLYGGLARVCVLLTLAASTAGFTTTSIGLLSTSRRGSGNSYRPVGVPTTQRPPQPPQHPHEQQPQSPRGTTTTTTTHSGGTSTQLSIATATAALAALNSACQASPYTAGALVCGLKSCTADWMAQTKPHEWRQRQRDRHAQATLVARRSATTNATTTTTTTTTILVEPTPRPRTDRRQNLAFTLYGALYLGVTQEFVYNHIYPAMFGAGTGWKVVLSKVCFDLFCQSTIFTLPIAYLAKALIFRYSVKEALRRYRNDIFQHGLLTKYCMLWGPVQCLTFSIIPIHLRVSFTAFVSFFWMLVLSNISSKQNGDGPPDDCAFNDGLTCNAEG